ncbi:MAG: hypothetical protein QOJ38_384 [Solirubrobacterales bacterium]|nr:hypothetical protein [Solirubrobacterales bacterium]
MSENGVPQPTELIHLAKPTAAPAFTAAGIALMLIGIYAHGFVLPSWIFALAGAIFFLGGLRSWLRAARHDVIALPREQHPRPAVLPPAHARRARDL